MHTLAIENMLMRSLRILKTLWSISIGRSESKARQFQQAVKELNAQTEITRSIVLGHTTVLLNEDWQTLPGEGNRHKIIFEDSDILAIKAETRDLELEAHAHTEFKTEVVVVAKGKVKYKINGAAIEVLSGDAHVIDATKLHEFNSTGTCYIIFTK